MGPPFCCRYCRKGYAFSTSRYRHQKDCQAFLLMLREDPSTERVALEPWAGGWPIPTIAFHLPKGWAEHVGGGPGVPGDSIHLFLALVDRLWRDPRNQCIHKTSLRTHVSYVHRGGERWEARPDGNLYICLARIFANTFAQQTDNPVHARLWSGVARLSPRFLHTAELLAGALRKRTVALHVPDP